MDSGTKHRSLLVTPDQRNMSRSRKRFAEPLTESFERSDPPLTSLEFFENYIAADRVAQLKHLNWMTTIEAAQYLRVSVGSIKNKVYRGQLVPKKLGRRNRFWKDDLDRTLRTPFTTKGKL